MGILHPLNKCPGPAGGTLLPQKTLHRRSLILSREPTMAVGSRQGERPPRYTKAGAQAPRCVVWGQFSPGSSVQVWPRYELRHQLGLAADVQLAGRVTPGESEHHVPPGGG